MIIIFRSFYLAFYDCVLLYYAVGIYFFEPPAPKLADVGWVEKL